MKYTFLPVLLIACCFFSTSCKKDKCEPKPSNVDLKKGLIAYYKFDGNTADSSGNGNHGQLINDGQLGYDEHGNANSALDCYNHNQGLLVNNNGKIKFDTAFTVSLDIMTRDYQPNSFFNFINFSSETAQSFSMGNNIFDEGKNWAMFVNTGSDFCSKKVLSYNEDEYVKTNTEYQLTESWYNLIVSFQKGKVNVYVNGTLDKTGTFSNSVLGLCSEAQLVLGNYSSETAYGLNGKMDEVRLYNRILNADEIAEVSRH